MADDTTEKTPTSISSIAFKYRRLVLVIVGALMLYGFWSYFDLPAREDPEITIRQAMVQTRHPGLPPDRVELLITKTLEEAIIQLPEIEEIRSSSLPGLSIIHVEILDRYTNLEQIWDDLRQRIDTVRSDLPNGTLPPEVDDRFGDVAVITMAMTAEGYMMGTMFDHAQHVRDMLYSVEGVESIEILGVQEERVFLEFSTVKLAQMGISPEQLAQILQQENVIHPGGIIDTTERQFLIEPSGNFLNLEDIRNTLLTLPGQQRPVPLRDVLDVSYGTVDPPVRTVYFNGKPALMFAITMRDNANILDFSPRVKEKIEQLEKLLPAGYQLQIATYQAKQVSNAINGVTFSVLQTLGIVLVIVILFLGLRTGLIVGGIVPSVMLITLAVMNFTGIDLERMSLATLIISLGLLVDNGIVIAEDFIHRLESGETRKEALGETGRELAVPLLTSSLTTILVFMPLILAEHMAGEYTRSISLVILITLSVSWFIALMVTPIFCFYFAKSSVQKEKEKNKKEKQPFSDRLFSFMNHRYQWLLVRILKNRIFFLILIAAALIGTFFIFQVIESEFFPDSDRTQILVYIDLPADASATATDQALREIMTYVTDRNRFPHIEDATGYVGFGGPRFVLSLTPVDPTSNKAFMVINVDKAKHMEPLADRLRQGFLDEFPDLRARVMRMFLGPTDSSIIEIQVKGPDADFIYQTALKIEDILRNIEDTIDIHNDWEGYLTHLKVEIDQQRAQRAGVTSAMIARALQRYYSGEIFSEFRDGDDVYPIMLRAGNVDRHDPKSIGALNVFSETTGQTVPLYQVANIELFNDFARRERENLLRTVTIKAHNLRLTAQQLKPLIEDEIEQLRQSLPPNYHIEYDGVIQEAEDAQSALQANLPLALGLIFIVMIWQFNSYRRTAIVFITLPLLIIGGLLGLLIFAAPFSFMVTLGFYALAGILANNAIVLIDRIDIERRQQESGNDWDAVVSASVRRLRPIIMSTVTTVLGLMPLIISRDVLFYGMAAAIATGLTVGTVLTLGLVPVLYTFFFSIKEPENGQNNKKKESLA
ncbi:MAG: efflux RND transporter permease subunit [Desulforhopalus sp.]